MSVEVSDSLLREALFQSLVKNEDNAPEFVFPDTLGVFIQSLSDDRTMTERIPAETEQSLTRILTIMNVCYSCAIGSQSSADSTTLSYRLPMAATMLHSWMTTLQGLVNCLPQYLDEIMDQISLYHKGRGNLETFLGKCYSVIRGMHLIRSVAAVIDVETPVVQPVCAIPAVKPDMDSLCDTVATFVSETDAIRMGTESKVSTATTEFNAMNLMNLVKQRVPQYVTVFESLKTRLMVCFVPYFTESPFIAFLEYMIPICREISALIFSGVITAMRRPSDTKKLEDALSNIASCAFCVVCYSVKLMRFRCDYQPDKEKFLNMCTKLEAGIKEAQDVIIEYGRTDDAFMGFVEYVPKSHKYQDAVTDIKKMNDKARHVIASIENDKRFMLYTIVSASTIISPLTEKARNMMMIIARISDGVEHHGNIGQTAQDIVFLKQALDDFRMDMKQYYDNKTLDFTEKMRIRHLQDNIEVKINLLAMVFDQLQVRRSHELLRTLVLMCVYDVQLAICTLDAHSMYFDTMQNVMNALIRWIHNLVVDNKDALNEAVSAFGYENELTKSLDQTIQCAIIGISDEIFRLVNGDIPSSLTELVHLMTNISILLRSLVRELYKCPGAGANAHVEYMKIFSDVLMCLIRLLKRSIQLNLLRDAEVFSQLTNQCIMILKQLLEFRPGAYAIKVQFTMTECMKVVEELNAKLAEVRMDISFDLDVFGSICNIVKKLIPLTTSVLYESSSFSDISYFSDILKKNSKNVHNVAKLLETLFECQKLFELTPKLVNPLQAAPFVLSCLEMISSKTGTILYALKQNCKDVTYDAMGLAAEIWTSAPMFCFLDEADESSRTMVTASALIVHASAGAILGEAKQHAAVMEGIKSIVHHVKMLSNNAIQLTDELEQEEKSKLEAARGASLKMTFSMPEYRVNPLLPNRPEIQQAGENVVVAEEEVADASYLRTLRIVASEDMPVAQFRDGTMSNDPGLLGNDETTFVLPAKDIDLSPQASDEASYMRFGTGGITPMTESESQSLFASITSTNLPEILGTGPLPEQEPPAVGPISLPSSVALPDSLSTGPMPFPGSLSTGSMVLPDSLSTGSISQAMQSFGPPAALDSIAPGVNLPNSLATLELPQSLGDGSRGLETLELPPMSGLSSGSDGIDFNDVKPAQALPAWISDSDLASDADGAPKTLLPIPDWLESNASGALQTGMKASLATLQVPAGIAPPVMEELPVGHVEVNSAARSLDTQSGIQTAPMMPYWLADTEQLQSVVPGDSSPSGLEPLADPFGLNGDVRLATLEMPDMSIQSNLGSMSGPPSLVMSDSASLPAASIPQWLSQDGNLASTGAPALPQSLASTGAPSPFSMTPSSHPSFTMSQPGDVSMTAPQELASGGSSWLQGSENLSLNLNTGPSSMMIAESLSAGSGMTLPVPEALAVKNGSDDDEEEDDEPGWLSPKKSPAKKKKVQDSDSDSESDEGPAWLQNAGGDEDESDDEEEANDEPGDPDAAEIPQFTPTMGESPFAQYLKDIPMPDFMAQSPMENGMVNSPLGLCFLPPPEYMTIDSDDDDSDDSSSLEDGALPLPELKLPFAQVSTVADPTVVEVTQHINNLARDLSMFLNKINGFNGTSLPLLRSMQEHVLRLETSVNNIETTYIKNQQK